MIDPSALIDPTAQLGDAVEVGPEAIIESGVAIGSHTRIASQAVIKTGTRLGSHVSVGSQSVIGGLPQDFSFDPFLPSGVEVGDYVQMGIGVTIHRATQVGAVTRLCESSILEDYAHIGHDSCVESHVYLGAHVLVGGHVAIASHARIGAHSGIHQRMRVGTYALVDEATTATLSIPPYMLCRGRNEFPGFPEEYLEEVAGITQATLTDLKACFHALHVSPGPPKPKAQTALDAQLPKTEAGKIFLQFFIEAPASHLPH
ncbi:MAG TPA: acyl-[acyl-carrier-protein]--UDP-N-acetylglucosamine O-acyltransferase [Opitutae bacterium]|nr:acyl-[acyl-carrier-protein]--UDP-N-acetylglucosamine O-acyltransferase [Opitutae bacterium]|tara:strand:+ start:535 stop:1311 length:777 start_codon:yes stop_codon:yes gene_type:complete